MYFRLVTVTLERLGNVSWKILIDLFFDYRFCGITADSDHITAMLLSVLTPIPMTTTVFILIQTTIPRIYCGIRGTTVSTVPTRVSNLNQR